MFIFFFIKNISIIQPQFKNLPEYFQKRFDKLTHRILKLEYNNQVFHFWTAVFNIEHVCNVFTKVDIASGMKRWHNRPMPDCNQNRQIFFYEGNFVNILYFIKSCNIYALYIILDFLNLFCKPIYRNFVVFYNTRNLKFVNSKGKWNKFCYKRINIFSFDSN